MNPLARSPAVQSLSHGAVVEKEEEPAIAQESEELRLLHEKAKENLYDPFVPNDLLQYWERKAVVAERERLEQEQREKLELQTRLREQLEAERRSLAEKGDLKRMAEHQMAGMGRGRGRGRGLSNLPAWLVEKQKKEAELGDLPGKRQDSG